MLLTAAKGWGVRTMQDVSQGTFICQYFGELISCTEAARRAEDTYYFVVDVKAGQECCLDGRHYGSVGRFLNHSCRPNLVALQVAVGHEVPGIAFFSTRAIQAGEELGRDRWNTAARGCRVALCGCHACLGRGKEKAAVSWEGPGTPSHKGLQGMSAPPASLRRAKRKAGRVLEHSFLKKGP
uniref:SET domain-containing protein n=1 Tax=Varanus komodoensis TaxID=61221 RepID=A0A8D2INX7_VARKO